MFNLTVFSTPPLWTRNRDLPHLERSKEHPIAIRRDKEEVDTNPDPIPGAQGAHPVGVGLGTAVGGAAARAAGGTIAGPAGAIVGAVVGGVAGG